jgi:hypothetical protein
MTLTVAPGAVANPLLLASAAKDVRNAEPALVRRAIEGLNNWSGSPLRLSRRGTSTA